MEHEATFPLSKTPWVFFYDSSSTESTLPKARHTSMSDTSTMSPCSRAAAQLASWSPPGCHRPTYTQLSTRSWVPPGHPWLAANPRASVCHGSHVPWES